MSPKRVLSLVAIFVCGATLLCACAFDTTLRLYLKINFWMPFTKDVRSFAKPNVKRISEPFAGMGSAQGTKPLARLRAAYQTISQPQEMPFDPAPMREIVAQAYADSSLSARDREEVELIDAKIDIRLGQPSNPAPFQSAQGKLEAFLKSARTPEFLSEARGWLGYVHRSLGEQTSAGKIYLDELNRDGSNLSEETLLNSLRITYGYDGGPQLLEHLDEYFDTPEHAAFAIQRVTNTSGDDADPAFDLPKPNSAAQRYSRLKALINQHRDLLKSDSGPSALSLLEMRVALKMGDPPEALRVASMVPATAPVRKEPDFDWMLASAYYLSHDFAGAEAPLMHLFQSSRATKDQNAAAAYGLCGVYLKAKNPVQQIWFALWLADNGPKEPFSPFVSEIVYWPASGFDLDLLLDYQASVEDLRAFVDKYPNEEGIRKVQYALAVRLARENKYEEAATIYESIQAKRRAPRMRELASLYAQTKRDGLSPSAMAEAKYRFAEFLASHSDGIYFNDNIWYGRQRYALSAEKETGLNRSEHQQYTDGERKLKDDQEELWRAYGILRDVVHDSGGSEIGQKSAKLAIRCLRRIATDRFGREQEIAQVDRELTIWLQKHP